MRVGIMQPYFLPYIGYFQLIQHCDQFVVYDDVEYTKRGWVNRNRVLDDGAPRTITLPLRKASDYLDVRDREIAPEFDAGKMLALLHRSYFRAPFWSDCGPTLEAILKYPSRNLFSFVMNSILRVSECLNVTTDIIVSSTLEVDRSLRGEARVLATCEHIGATEYVNPIGGLDLYNRDAFAERGISLSFLRSRLTPYRQFTAPFVEALSIVDAMAFVAPHELRSRVQSDYEIVES